VIKLITWPIRLILAPLMVLATIAYVVAGVTYFEPWKPKTGRQGHARSGGTGWTDLLGAENAPLWKDLAGTQTSKYRTTRRCCTSRPARVRS